jgi:hypothetical protein
VALVLGLPIGRDGGRVLFIATELLLVWLVRTQLDSVCCGSDYGRESLWL